MTQVAVLAALVVAYAAVARRLDRWSVTPAIVFTAAGALLGPSGLGALTLEVDAEAAKLLAEGALAILLFADATTVSPRGAERDSALTGRLLLGGLPLTVVAGTLAGILLLGGLSLAEAALLAAVLAPTDAALGMAVFTNRAVPARVRRVLNVESGLNDGLATPVVTLLIALTLTEVATPGTEWVLDALSEMAIGAGLGAAVGAVGGLLLARAAGAGWGSPGSLAIGVLALGALAFAGPVAAGGNGFVAAFTAGLVFRAATRDALKERVEYAETTGQVLAMLVWAVFGALFAGAAIGGGLALAPIAYAVLSLTLVRMVPVALALTGCGLQRSTVAFMGWFGPRGLASVVFTLLILIEVADAGAEVPSDLVLAATWTIMLSVLAHGLTAGWLGRRYGAAIDRRGPGLPETEGPEPAPRRRVPGQAAAVPES
jgi:NhaP-type Na+/H+ or K+/H+ antiporter